MAQSALKSRHPSPGVTTKTDCWVVVVVVVVVVGRLLGRRAVCHMPKGGEGGGHARCDACTALCTSAVACCALSARGEGRRRGMLKRPTAGAWHLQL